MSKTDRPRFTKRRTSMETPAVLEALEPRLLLSLVAHLELNETSGPTAADTVSDHDGTRYGGTVWDDGRIDNGAYFDGSGDYIDVANSDDFNYGTSGSFSISAWVKDDGSGSFAAAVNRGHDSAIGLGWGWYTEGPGFFMGKHSDLDNAYIFALSDGTAGTCAVCTPTDYADGYHLLTMVVDRSADEMYAYIDGTLFATKDISSVGSLDCGTEALQIGGGGHWEGMIDDVRVYDNALSDTDVANLYADAPTWVTIYADDPIATEDDSGADTATFRVLRTGTLSGAITVNYSVSGTATSADYSETLGGTVTIGDGVSETTITITPVDDAADDAQTVTLTLASGTGYVVSGIDDATAVIYDDAGLLAHWTLDETSGSTAADSTGHGYGATLIGNTTWTDGWVDNGAYLDGSGDYIAVDDAGTIDFGEGQSFTVTAWVRDDSASQYHTVIAKGNEDIFYGQYYEGAGWGMGQCVYNKTYGYGVSDGTNRVFYVSNGTASSDGEFHLMSMVVDRDSGYLNCYLDGQLLGQRDISAVGSLASFGEALNIGGDGNGWLGVLDDVRIYTYALDGTENQILYEGTMPPVTIAAIDSIAVEDNADTATFRVSRSGTSGALTVNYSVSGTATGADYSETLSGTVTIADGNSYADITITPVDDATADNAETLTITLASGTGYQPGQPNEATATIYDTGQLLMHLKLDETSGSTAADDTDNGHTGTLYGDATWDDGRLDNGAYFDGTDDAIEVANSNDFDFGSTASFTVSAWVRDDGDAYRAAAVSRGNTRAGSSYTEGAGWSIGHYEYETGRFFFGITDGTVRTSVKADEIYEPGTFHLLTMVVDRSAQQMSAYVDGELAGTVSIATIGSISSPGEALTLAESYDENWQGMVDDVRLYNMALTANDVASLYSNAPLWALITATDSTAIEDDADTAGFRIYRTGTSGDLTVNYSVSGTAGSGDYSETLGGTVTIADGQSYVDITITPVSDGSDNGETLTLTLASGNGYTVGNISDATATIYDTGQLLAHLTLDETSGSTADDSAGDHDGTLYGDTTWDDGRDDNGAYFDGSGDSIAVANSTDFNFGASQSFTVSAWVRDDGAGNFAPALARGGDTTGLGLGWGVSTQGPGWFIGRYSTISNSFLFMLTDGVTAANSSAYAPIYNNGFHLLTMVVDRSAQEMQSYVDGMFISAKDISAIGSISSGEELMELSGGGKWKGMVDDVRVYNYALSESDVGDIYNDAPAWINIYAEDAAVGTDTITFRLIRTGSTDDAVTMGYSVSGTAISADYSETLSGTVTFGVGESVVDVTVTPVSDGTVDDGETLVLTLTGGTGCSVGDTDEVTGVIYDEAGLLAHWEMDETSGTTASDSTGNGFTATGVGGVAWTYGRVDNGTYLTADYFKVDDACGLDLSGNQSFTISAWVQDEGDGSSPAVIAKGNTKAHYGQTADGAGWSMGRYGGAAFAFGVTDGSEKAFFTTLGDYDTDFHLMTMVVDRGADIMRCYVDGELLAQKDISTLGSLGSFAETLYIGLGYSKWTGVLDDVRIYNYALTNTDVTSLYASTVPVVSIEALDDVASETGSEPGMFRITRDGDTTEALEVDYTVTGTAAGADYSETLSGTVTIAAGENYVDITVTPVDDASNEGDETVIVTLTPSPTDYSILTSASATATVTLGDSDNVADPQVVIGMVDSEASEDGNDPATFRIYRSDATTSDLAVNYTVSGTAESNDYSETLSGTVTIASGNSYADITITPITDDNFEYPEVLVLTLTADANYSIGLSDEASAILYDIPFSAQLNPTGDPIGGAEGYSDIIDIGDADYVVDTAGELVDALSSATYGDIIYVEDDAEIDLTGYISNSSYNALWIPAGVTLASGRGNNGSQGGLIYTTDEWTNYYRVAMLGTNGDDIRITGLRIQGPSGWCEDRATDNMYASGIRCGATGSSGNHKNIEIDNCEIYNWTMAGVYVMYGEGVNVHHNHIHTNIGEGYQYGIWFGATPALDAEWAAEANANLFDCNRHDIGSACHWPWAARYNIFGPNQYYQILDRHGGNSLDTWIENNWCQAESGTEREFRCGFNIDYGGTVYYNNNWTPKEEAGPGSYTTAAIVGDPLYFETEAADNTFSFDEHDEPYTPVSSTDVTYLSTPLTVAFDSSDSYDPEGNDIVSHEWWLGDGSGTQGVMSIEDNPTYTYSDPGLYEVIHYAYNEYGVPGYDSTDVIVRPEEGGYWLSAWIKDSRNDNIPAGTATKQILIDDQVVWSDDVLGDEGWQHVVLDISAYVTEGVGAKLAFRLVSTGGNYHAAVGIDNVYIFGGDVADSHMTNSYVWTEYDPDGGDSYWDVSVNEERVGRLATTGGKLLTWGIYSGMTEIYQVVPIGKALQPMVTDDFESGDGTGGENWDANWVLTGSAAVTSSGTPFDGTYHLLLTGSSAVASRAVDLSDYGDDVTLSFQYKADSFEAGEEVSVEIYDGTQWQEVMVIEDGDDDGEYHLASIDLSGYSLTDDFEVRFTASLADASDFFYVDDLMIA